jgi:hypothetical protein
VGEENVVFRVSREGRLPFGLICRSLLFFKKVGKKGLNSGIKIETLKPLKTLKK